MRRYQGSRGASCGVRIEVAPEGREPPGPFGRDAPVAAAPVTPAPVAAAAVPPTAGAFDAVAAAATAGAFAGAAVAPPELPPPEFVAAGCATPAPGAGCAAGCAAPVWRCRPA